MARAALRWSLDDLTTAADVGRATISRFEMGGSVGEKPVTAMRLAMEKAGAKFSRRGDRVSVSVPD